jgi:hypothetical protein
VDLLDQARQQRLKIPHLFWIHTGASQKVTIPELVITADQLPWLFEKLTVASQLQASLPERTMAVIRQLKIIRPDASRDAFVLQEVKAGFFHENDRSGIVIQFLPLIKDTRSNVTDKLNDDRPCEIKIGFDTSTDAKSKWHINTNGHVMPTWTAYSAFPWLENAGTRAHFSGEVTTFRDAHESYCTIKNSQLTNVNLQTLMDPFAQVLRGQATLFIREGVINDQQKIDRLSGTLQCKPDLNGKDNFVGVGLLRSAFELLRLDVTLPSEIQNSDISPLYSELNCDFDLSADGLLVSGRCDQDGTLLMSPYQGGEPIVRGVQQHLISIPDFVSFLLPDSIDGNDRPFYRENEQRLRDALPDPDVQQVDFQSDESSEFHQ